MAFSTLCRDQVARQNNKVIIVIGGNYHAHLNIFEWMLRWADGNAAFPQISQKPFLLTFRLCQTAHILGCQTLVDVIERHTKPLANVMPMPMDVQAVYLEFPIGHPARKLTVHSIATAIVAGWAKVDDPEMEKLCESRKDLLDDINEALPKLYAAKEKYDADQEKELRHIVEKQKAEARARGGVKAQELKDRIRRSIQENQKLRQGEKDQLEAKMAEEKARRQMENTKKRKQAFSLLCAS